MATTPKIDFVKLAPATQGTVVVFAGADLKFGPQAQALLQPLGDGFSRIAALEKFTGKARSMLDLVLPAGTTLDRILVVGTGAGENGGKAGEPIRLGATIAARLAGRSGEVRILAETPSGSLDAEAAADMALGIQLRSYSFDRYKTKKKPDEPDEQPKRIEIAVADLAGAKKAFKARAALNEGVTIARDLVNEPANALGPEEFAEHALALTKLGVEVEVLDEQRLHTEGLAALLAVGQGSSRESRVVIMRWNGAPRGSMQQPVAVIGKGVVFDSGGISIKPGGGMEDMKGDMAGAACVVGLMHVLAARKAKVNVVGAIGVVENMPDGNAQRPGDIVTSLSGQTIEIINTDAEGRLVLADVLTYLQNTYKPAAMVDLATLTGAVLVALGQENAGLFSNNDELSAELTAAGRETGELVWRLPLSPEYDKLIDSKFADMKNTGGRYGGSITAAQFIQRFVMNDTPWAHLDIAGTGMAAPQTDLNRSWGSGWGVRLLDRWLADVYEGERRRAAPLPPKESIAPDAAAQAETELGKPSR
jgi:leucyl aminopeptidase